MKSRNMDRDWVAGKKSWVLTLFSLSCSMAKALMSLGKSESKQQKELRSEQRHPSSCHRQAQVWEVKVLVAQCPTLCNPMDCSPPDASVHGILQARILEWVATPFSRGSSQPKDWTLISYIAGGFFTVWATREAFLRGEGGLKWRP